jgi:hypothetical protein
MQNLEIDDNAMARSELSDGTIPVTTTTVRTRRRRNFPSIVSSSLSSSPPRSRTTLERQCCAMLMVIFGMFISTFVVLNIARNYHPPWYYQAKSGIPLSDLLKNRPRNVTATVANVKIVIQNDTQSTGNLSMNEG